MRGVEGRWGVCERQWTHLRGELIIHEKARREETGNGRRGQDALVRSNAGGEQFGVPAHCPVM